MTNSQELKNKILKNLTDWCFDPLGNLMDAKALADRVYEDENVYWFRYCADSNPNWSTEPKIISIKLTPEDYQEVKEAMINEIKNASQDWKIEKEGDLTVIKHRSGRKHWKGDFLTEKGFKEEEWKEIETALNSQQGKDDTPSNPSSSEQQAQQKQPSKEIKYMDHVYYHRDNKY